MRSLRPFLSGIELHRHIIPLTPLCHAGQVSLAQKKNEPYLFPQALNKEILTSRK